jgi:hypothetical protein
MVVDVDDDWLLSAGPSSSQLGICRCSSSIVLLLLKYTNKKCHAIKDKKILARKIL